MLACDYICSYIYYTPNERRYKMSNQAKAKPTSVRINPELKAKIAAKAKEEGRSFNNMVSRILELSLAQ